MTLTEEELTKIGDAMLRARAMFTDNHGRAAQYMLDRLAEQGFELRRREDGALVFVRGRVK